MSYEWSHPVVKFSRFSTTISHIFSRIFVSESVVSVSSGRTSILREKNLLTSFMNPAPGLDSLIWFNPLSTGFVANGQDYVAGMAAWGRIHKQFSHLNFSHIYLREAYEKS